MESRSIRTHESESIQCPSVVTLESRIILEKIAVSFPISIILIKYFTLAQCSIHNQAAIETRDNYIQNLKMCSKYLKFYRDPWK